MPAPAESTSRSLLVRLQAANDQEAWARFVEIYTPLIFYWARRMGLQQAEAADLVQEVLALLVVKLPNFHLDSQGSFRSWLRTVTTNKLREIWRKKTLNWQPASQSALADIPEETNTKFWEVEYRQQLVDRLLQLARKDFAPKTWQALHSLITTDRPAAEVADEFQINVWTLYSAKSRLLARLRREAADLLE